VPGPDEAGCAGHPPEGGLRGDRPDPGDVVALACLIDGVAEGAELLLGRFTRDAIEVTDLPTVEGACGLCMRRV
jgi:hypothetical protein